ncbi:MAG: hypothetical protein IKS41_04425 [Alphaproteobacteria bacterium]|nr:hypothetical protein [Alphaproteobacteria bacterium]
MFKRETDSYTLGERVKKSDAPHGFRVIYSSEIGKEPERNDVFLDKKSVLFLPGDASAKTPKEINGHCKVVEKMLMLAGMKPEDMPHLYGLGYTFQDSSKHRESVIHEVGENKFFGDEESQRRDTASLKDYWKPFFDAFLFPLIADEKGEKRSVSEIRKNLQNITLVSHCHGGMVSFRLEQMMSEKLAEFYPGQEKELMGNLRMMHFSSRRPLKQSFGAKHFHIIAQNDPKYADDWLLDADNLNNRISLNLIKQPFMLMPVRPEEEILTLNKIEPTDEDYDAHGSILEVFSGQMQEKTEQNNEAIEVTQKLLRYFVEHPEDKRSMADILSDQNHKFVSENTPIGVKFMQEAKEEERINRGLLSILADPRINFGGIATMDPAVLRERNDEGQFLYDVFFENFKKTGDSRSLVQYLRDTQDAMVDGKRKDEGRMMAIQKRDWRLLGAYGYIGSDEVLKVVQVVRPEDFRTILPVFEAINNAPEACHLFIQKSKKIKNSSDKLKLDAFIRESLEKMPACYLKKVLKLSSLAEKKEIKNILSERRKKEAEPKIQALRDRDAKAPSVRLNELLKFYSATGHRFGIDDFLEYREEQKKDRSLNPHQFLRKKLLEK